MKEEKRRKDEKKKGRRKENTIMTTTNPHTQHQLLDTCASISNFRILYFPIPLELYILHL